MKWSWIPLRELLPIAGYVVCFLGVNLAMRYVAETAGQVRLAWFIGGNVVGFLCTIFLPLALRGANPNIVYAVCIGGGFCLLQVLAFFLFKESLTFWQWLGIGFVGLGILCLQIKAV